MRRINAHIWNREDHNNRTEFKKIALIFDLWKEEWHFSSATYFRDPEPSVLYYLWGIKKPFHDIEDYFPSLNRIEKEIKSRCTFSYKSGERWDNLCYDLYTPVTSEGVYD